MSYVHRATAIDTNRPRPVFIDATVAGVVPLACFVYGTPGPIRTGDQLLRRQLLYPLSYGRWHNLERATRFELATFSLEG